MPLFGSKHESFASQIKNLVRETRSALWFRPTVFCLLGATVIVLIGVLDAAGMTPKSLNVDADSLKALLRFMASGMLTVITVTISVLMLVLSIAAGHASPRALPELMADRVIQNVLGVFLATLVYALAGLTILQFWEISAGGRSVISIVALVLIVFVLKYLIQWIDHVASAIKLNRVVDRIYRETDRVLDAFLARKSGDRDADVKKEGFRVSCEIAPDGVGYIQLIDIEKLDRIATQERISIELAVREGDFANGKLPVLIARSDDKIGRERLDEIRHCLVIGPERSPEGDPLLGFELLAEVASRALSPGVNDPQSAIVCVNYLGALLAKAASIPPMDYPSKITPGGRVACRTVELCDMLKRVVRPIAKDASDRMEVLAALAQVLLDLAETADEGHLDAILDEGSVLADSARGERLLESDRDLLNDMISRLKSRVGERRN